ncbi:MAG: NAD(P)-binding domain-containing protein [Devosia nanyangense]|uniref:NAD(P)-binding domain-containing protein n=1 Tax=Devosia nanyangense TaxID=1228055 RepID=A0A933L289_9HYPH|nr:NAD(P)-binding domain-containing protein [Devosia nanyangense]
MTQTHIAVVGAGLMGHGIAYLFGAAGHRVRVQDPSPAALEQLPLRLREICDLLGTDRATADQVEGSSSLAEAVADADFVFEAVPEKLELKQQLFAELERLAPARAIFCSNTSSIPIASIGARLADPSRLVGAHFWNPPHLVRLVEVVVKDEANRAAAERVVELLRAAGRHPVVLNRDIPGFVGNRLQHALKREAIALVAAGVCDAETIDDVVKLGFGARLAVLGPLEQSDLVGLDLTKAIHDVLISDLDVTPHTHPYLDALVAKGELGMKTGKGFRSWTPETAAAVRERLRTFLAKSARADGSESGR